MEAYQACTGWSNILDYVKTRVGDLPGYKEKTIEYYDKTNRKAAIKRIKRIINQQRKHSQISKPNQSSSMLSTINNKDMRYATKQTPEQRIKQKLAIAAANVSSSTDDEMIMVLTRMMAKAQAVWKCKDQRIIHHKHPTAAKMK